MGGREFRVLVMIDMVDSTSTLRHIGDAAWTALLVRHRTESRAVARRHGGDYLGHTGDGMLLSFPSPGVALRCASALAHRADELGVPVRVGVHAGEVEQVEDGVGGIAVHAAARLAAVAAAGEVVVSPAVVPLVAGSDLRFDDRGEQTLKGLAEPWRLWRLHPVLDADRPETDSGAVTVPGPPLPHALDVADVPFVGRAAARAVADLAWGEVAAGGSASLVVSGEPGVGKTRLVAELCRSAHADGALVLFGRCDEGLRAPYQPFVESLSALLVQLPAHRAHSLLGSEAGELTRLLPAVADVVPGARAGDDIGPEGERHRLFVAVASWLAATAARAPLVLVTDDVHWAEEGTLALLRHVARAGVPRLLVVATFRDTEADVGPELSMLLSDLARERHSHRLALGGLDQGEVATLLRGPTEVVELLTRETNGNPFFLGEVLRDLAERGQAVRTGDVWVTSDRLSIDVPAGVREAVQRRVGALDARCLPVLTAAAAIGLEVDLGLVTAMTGIDETDVLAALETATAARLLDEVPGGDRWRFAHALVRSALLEGVSAARRRRLHRDVVAVAGRVRASMSAADVAGHALAAGDLVDAGVAAQWAERAACQAQGSAAPAEALRWWQAAVAAMARDDEPDLRRVADLRCRLAAAAVRAGAPEWDALAEQALAAALVADAPDLAAQAALVAANTWWNGSITARGITRRGRRLIQALHVRGAPDVLAHAGRLAAELDAVGVRLQAALANELMWDLGSLPLRDRLSRDALDRARVLGDVQALAEATRCRCTAVWSPRTARERGSLALHAEELARRDDDAYALLNAAALLGISGIETGDPSLLSRSAIARADASGGAAQTIAGYHLGILDVGRQLLTDVVRAAETADELKQMGESVGHPDAAVYHFYQQQYAGLLRGVPGDGIDLLVGTVTAVPHTGTPALAAALLALAGRAGEAPPLLEASIGLVGTCDNVLEGAAVGGLAVASALLQDARGAEAALAAMQPLDARCLGSGLVYVGATAHWRGVCHAVLDDRGSARRELLEGRQLYERLGLRVGLALSDAELARLLLADGDRPAAARLAAQARSIAQPCGAGLAVRRLESVGL